MNIARLMTTSLVACAAGLLGCSSDSAQNTGGAAGSAASAGAGGSAASSGAGGSAASSGAGGSAASSGAGGSAANSGAGGSAASSGAGGGAASSGAGGGAASSGAGGGVVYLDAGEESCGATKAEAEVKLVNILLVIDKSGSMAETPTGFATDKWTAMKTALGAALEPVKGAISFGLELFPFDTTARIPLTCGGACCLMPTGAAAMNIPIEPGTTGLPKITGAVASQDPGGATPAAAALREALTYFTTGAGAALAGAKYVVLATDGAPNCNAGANCTKDTCTVNIEAAGKVGAPPCVASGTNCCTAAEGGSPLQCLDDGATVTQISALKAAGVGTFVIGIPGSENYVAALDSFAAAGGQAASATADAGDAASATSPKYFAVAASGGAAALTDVFKSITTKLVTACDLKLKSDPPDPTMLNVTIDGALVPKAGGEAGANGWTLDQSTSPPTVNLVGKTCDTIKASGAKNVQVLFGCPYVPVN